MLELTKVIVRLSIYFLILFTAHNAFGTIVTRVHEEEGDEKLGPFLFSLNYTTFMIMNLFAPLLTYSLKWQIALSSIAYTFNFATNIFMIGQSEAVKYSLSAIGAVVNGISASFLWVSLGRYIHNACHHFNDIENKGYYYGMFNTIYCSSNIFSGIVITFGLELLSHRNYFILVTGIGVFSFLYSVLMIKNIK